MLLSAGAIASLDGKTFREKKDDRKAYHRTAIIKDCIFRAQPARHDNESFFELGQVCSSCSMLNCTEKYTQKKKQKINTIL